MGSRWTRDGKLVDQTVEVVESSGQKAVAVTPSDSVSLVDGVTKGLYIGGSGDASVVMADGSSVTFKGLTGGVIHPLSVKRVNATSTTATNIIAVY